MKTYQMQNLIINRLSIAGIALMYFGAYQHVFTIGEAIAGASALIGALMATLIEG
jgi:hypothetical protein